MNPCLLVLVNFIMFTVRNCSRNLVYFDTDGLYKNGCWANLILLRTDLAQKNETNAYKYLVRKRDEKYAWKM
jgi:hypothetical protein